MTFLDYVNTCLGNRELLIEFDRLRGTNLSEIGCASPINSMIDEATGRNEDSMAKFVEFVYDAIWCRCEGLSDGETQN